MRITKIMTFDAAHKLPEEPVYGKCQNLHGHTYKLEVTVEGKINRNGWVIDFSYLKEIMEKFIDKYDHSYLNDHQEFKNKPTTAENIVEHLVICFKNYFNNSIFKIFKVKIRLWETPTSYAEEEVLI